MIAATRVPANDTASTSLLREKTQKTNRNPSRAAPYRVAVARFAHWEQGSNPTPIDFEHAYS